MILPAYYRSNVEGRILAFEFGNRALSCSGVAIGPIVFELRWIIRREVVLLAVLREPGPREGPSHNYIKRLDGHHHLSELVYSPTLSLHQLYVVQKGALVLVVKFIDRWGAV